MSPAAKTAVVLAAAVVGAALWLGLGAAAITVYHHFTR